jgi:hypothetical protein
VDRIFHLISQPIQNSPWKMTFNLALAPLIIAVILFPYALFHEASSGIFSIFKSLFSALFISFFVCLTYWVMVFPFLLVTHLLLRHYQLFNILTILPSCVLGILTLAYIWHHPLKVLSTHFFCFYCIFPCQSHYFTVFSAGKLTRADHALPVNFCFNPVLSFHFKMIQLLIECSNHICPTDNSHQLLLAHHRNIVERTLDKIRHQILNGL